MRAKHAAALREFKPAPTASMVENGLIDKRECTDVLCCLLFSMTMIAVLVMGVYGYVNGNVLKLIGPLDGVKNFCGVDTTG